MTRGQNQGKETNPGNFANDPEKAHEAGKAAHEKGRSQELGSEETQETSELGGKARSDNTDDEDMFL